jgi:hypothetical protein
MWEVVVNFLLLENSLGDRRIDREYVEFTVLGIGLV